MNLKPASGSEVGAKRYRIVPRKGEAFFYTLFFIIVIGLTLASFHPVYGVATSSLSFGSEEELSNGGTITRTVLHYVLAALVIVVSAAFVIWNGRRLIPGSPFDFVEVGPDGFTVGGLLGRHRRRWESIARFAVRTIPQVQPPIFWMRAVPRKRGATDLRFFMGGYAPFSLLPTQRKDMAAIAGWLELIKVSYHKGDTNLPPRPKELAASVIELPANISPKAAHDLSRGANG
jgi:hypothetical protein